MWNLSCGSPMCKEQSLLLVHNKCIIAETQLALSHLFFLLSISIPFSFSSHNTARERQQRLLQERLEKKRFQRRKSAINILVVQPADPDATSDYEEDFGRKPSKEPERKGEGLLLSSVYWIQSFLRKDFNYDY